MCGRRKTSVPVRISPRNFCDHHSVAPRSRRSPESAGITRRESEVLERLRGGRSNRDIAGELYLSERTIESHVASLMRKLQAANRWELAKRAEEMAADALGPPAALPAALELAAASAPLVGRWRERTELRAIWDRAVQGVAMTAVVSAEAGMGKSRLVADLAVQVHGQGAAVLHGACSEDSAVPYEPFLHALGEELLGRIRPGDDPRHAILGLLKGTAERVPVLVVVEDLQWATAATRDTVRFMARAAPRLRLMIALTCRDTLPDLLAETKELLGGLEREPTVQTIRLVGLDPPSVLELAAATAGAALDMRAATNLATETGGNPLLVLQALQARDGLAGAISVQGLLASRARRLAPGDDQVLDVAAVLGCEFDARLLGAVSGTPLAELLGALERAEAAGLLVSVPGAPGRWSFVHALFRRAWYDAMPSARRVRIHHDVAQLLAEREQVGAIDVVELAHHAYLACPLGGARLATEACSLAGDQAVRASATTEAADQYRCALEAAVLLEPSDESLVRDLRIRLGAILHNAGEAEGTSLLLKAAEEARAEPNPHQLATVASALSYYGSGVPGLPDSTVAELAEEALALAPAEASSTTARMLGVLATQRAMAGETATAVRLAEESLEVARTMDDPIVLGEAIMTARLALWSPDNLDQRVAIAQELAHLGDTTGSRLWSIHGRQGIAAFERERGDLAASFRALDEVDALIGDSPPAWTALLSVAMRANRLLLRGDLNGSERVAAEVFDLDFQPGAGSVAWIDPALWHRPQLLAIRYYQGRISELSSEIEQVPLGAASRAITTCALAHRGELHDARARLHDDMHADFACYPADSTWLVSMGWLAEAAELTGHAAAARSISERLAPYFGRLDNYGDGAFRPIGSALTQSALATGDAAAATRLAEMTISWCRTEGTPIFLARGLVQLAAARRRLGESGLDYLEEALSIAAETGAALIQQDVERYGLRTPF